MKRMFFSLSFALFLLVGCQQLSQPENLVRVSATTETFDSLAGLALPEEHLGDSPSENRSHPDGKEIISRAIETTLVAREEAGNAWKHTYYNEVLDYSDLCIEVMEFSPDGDADALSLKVTLPANWSDDISSFMKREGLRLRFDIDGRQVDAFRQRSITPQDDAHTYTLNYHKCILDSYDLSGKVLTIRPYISCYQWIESKEVVNGMYRRYNLAAGESFTGTYIGADQFNSDSSIVNLRSERIYLDVCAVSLPLATNGSEALMGRPAHINAVTFNDENWEKSIADGVYQEGSQTPPTGTVYLRNKDFSEISFAVEEFHIWQDEMKLSFVWRFPETWTDMECQAMVRESLNFLAYTGDKRPENLYGDKSVPFTTELKYLGAISHIGANPSWENYKTETFRELYFQNWNSILTPEQWKAETKLTIVPWYWRYTECDGTTIPANGFFYQDLFERELERVYLDDMAITLDITPDLFDAGL